jgi:Gpi18-like mannosyltransferase
MPLVMKKHISKYKKHNYVVIIGNNPIIHTQIFNIMILLSIISYFCFDNRKKTD